MLRIITAATALTILVACDSEGIDRATPVDTPDNAVSLNDGQNNGQTSAAGANQAANETGTDTGSTNGNTGADSDSSSENSVSAANGGAAGNSTSGDNTAGTNTGTTAAGNGSADGSGDDSDGSDEDNSVNPLGGSGSSDGGNSINALGGSGSSDGGASNGTDNNGGADNNSQPAATQPADDQPQQVAAVDASLNLEAPASGTTFVSTMGPIRSDNGPLCIGPKKDENGNVLFNERGNCPLVDFHGNLAFGDFILSTNAWNFCASSFSDWEQCVSVNESSAGTVVPRWDYDWGEEFQVNGQVWLVKSYPEIIYGVKSPGEYSGSSLDQTAAETGLPAKVSDMPFFKIDYAFSSEEYPTRGKDFNGQRLNGERNIAVEAFFHELSGDCDATSLIRNGTTSNQRFEVMVWLDAGAERLPAAPNDYVTTQTLDGIEYDIYTKPTDPEYIAFVSKTPTASGSINWTTFVEWTRANSHQVNETFGRGFNTVKLEDDWCMANILLGTEIWWGNGFFQADNWTISRTVR